MLAVILGGNYYVFFRLWHMMPPTVIGRVLLICLAVIVIISPVLSMGFGGALPSPLVSVMYKIGTSWIILFMYLLLFFLVIDILRLTHLVNLDKYVLSNWISLGIIAVGLIVLMGTGYYRYIHKVRVDLTISLDKKTDDNKPLKIVAISDLHLGYSIDRKEFEGWVDMINKENPDIVLIGGDVTDNNVKPLFEQDMAAVFKEIKSKYGVYTIFGNHEYIADPVNADKFLHSGGITVLRDSVALVDNRFYIVGRDDRSNPNRQSIESLIANLDKTKPILLLDHQPYELDIAEKNGIDFQFSGHTHDGQVWPISLVTKALFEKSHGYLKKGDSHFYVSSGLGIWGGKFRIGTRSEYVVITLKTNG